MTIAVDLGRKATKQTNKQNSCLNANGEDPDQTASEEVCTVCGGLFFQATSVQNFRTFTIMLLFLVCLIRCFLT